MITERSIRDRLATDREKVSRLPTWEEVEYLLDMVSDLRQGLREAGADLTLMEENLHRCEQARARENWM